MSGQRAAYDMAQAPLAITDPGDTNTIVLADFGAQCEMVSGASAETRTLANPDRPGILSTLRLKTDGGGDVTVTAANGLNVTGNTTAVFADAGDQLFMESVSATSGYRWEILVNTGSVSLS